MTIVFMVQRQLDRTLRATTIGFTAVLMWATLALLTSFSGSVPPFQLTAMAFTIAFLIGLVFWCWQGRQLSFYTRLPWQAWALGVTGLFGYHFFYFVAIQHAPPVEASLIAYLWPLLIVLLASCLPGERLRWFHILGGVTGFSGAALLISGGQGISFNWDYRLGYLAALVCAITWSSYSVLSRRFGSVPTSAVGGFCGVTALLAWLCHGLWEATVWPTGWQWAAILGLGLGPVGLAFFTWDYGVKHGSLKVLGALSYLAPLLSTLLLVLTGLATPSWNLLMASGLIVGGAVLASGEFFNSQ